jgi:signal transduction histidine kinase
MKTAKKRKGTLLGEELFRVTLITTLTILAVELITISVISVKMVRDQKAASEVTADEIALLLEAPLYNIDDAQAKMVCSALLSTGRISGIYLESAVSGPIMKLNIGGGTGLLPSQTRIIRQDDLVIGKVQLYFSEQDIVTTVAQFFELSLAIMLAVFLSNFLTIRFILLRRILVPFESVSQGVNRILAGDYDSVIPLSQYIDVNRFISLVNEMSTGIRTKKQELLDANNLLEQRVSERTAALEATVADLNKTMGTLAQAQNQLVLSEKLSALGQLSAEIAHELNTPLGAISSSAGMLAEEIDGKMTDWLDYYASTGAAERRTFRLLLELALPECSRLPAGNDRKERKELQKRLEDNGVSDARHIAEDLMGLGIESSVDRFVDVLKEPWFPVCLNVVSELVSLRKMARIIQVAENKATVVVGALKNYLRDGSRKELALEPVDIGAGIDTILVLLHNKIKKDVQVIRNYRSGFALGSASLLSQVWLNLINNALQAMEYQGALTVSTENVEDSVLVRIADSGHGIPDDVRGQIFEPFFTTKEYGNGLGLGLDICRQIVEQFNGNIEFESQPGYTCFTVRLQALR